MRPRSVMVSVEGYIGLPGSGKTYAMSKRGLAAIERGRRVYSNYGLEGTRPIEAWDHANVGNTKDPGPSCECGHCFVSISNAVVLVDEINLWAPSRMWASLPLGLLHRWAQVRKYQTQILWTAQHEARVDKAIREVTGWIWQCRPHNFMWGLLGQGFELKAYEPTDLRKERARPLDAQFMLLRRRVAASYDTMRLIDVGSQFGAKDRPQSRLGVDRSPVALVGSSSAPVPILFPGSDPWGIPSDAETLERWEGAGHDENRGPDRELRSSFPRMGDAFHVDALGDRGIRPASEA